MEHGYNGGIVNTGVRRLHDDKASSFFFIRGHDPVRNCVAQSLGGAMEHTPLPLVHGLPSLRSLSLHLARSLSRSLSPFGPPYIHVVHIYLLARHWGGEGVM